MNQRKYQITTSRGKKVIIIVPTDLMVTYVKGRYGMTRKILNFTWMV